MVGWLAELRLERQRSARRLADVREQLAQIRQRLEATDNVPTGGKAADFARQIEAESRSNAQIIKAAGIQTN